MNYKDLELLYLQSSNIQHREMFAQFFTPIPIAKTMTNWIDISENKKILDPAFGLGVFYEFCSNKLARYDAYELDKNIIDYYLCNNIKPNMFVSQANYLDSNDELYDGIICNPPYLKFHDYDNKKYVTKINKKFNLNLPYTTNLYTLFIIKSLNQISYGGRLAYIVPIEFLNSDYGVEVKRYLLNSGKLRHIAIFDPKINLFNSALTTSCILLCSNDELNHSECGFSLLKDSNDMDLFNDFIKRYPKENTFENAFPQSEIDPNKKWSIYYNKREDKKYKYLVPFSTYGKVSRGIATGANDYFVFNKSKADFHELTEDSLSYCICRTKDVPHSFFTNNLLNELKKLDKHIYLFNAKKTNEFEKNTLRYIKKGEIDGIDKKYLTSSRKPWYSIEKREPAPIWVGVFNRNGLKFIRNEANILNLTNFHCVYTKYDDINLLFAYLISDISKDIFNENKRVYGNGLNKFEPNDLNEGYMLDIDRLSAKAKDDVLKSFEQYKICVLTNDINSSLYLKKINEIFRVNFEK